MKECPVVVKVAAYITICLGVIGIPVLFFVAFAMNAVRRFTNETLQTTGSELTGTISVLPHIMVVFFILGLVFITIDILAAIFILRSSIWAYYTLITTTALGIIGNHSKQSIIPIVILILLLIGYNDYRSFSQWQNASSGTPPPTN